MKIRKIMSVFICVFVIVGIFCQNIQASDFTEESTYTKIEEISDDESSEFEGGIKSDNNGEEELDKKTEHDKNQETTDDIVGFDVTDVEVVDFTLSDTDEHVAKVGEVYFTSVEEAIDAWTDGTTLTLLSDVTLSSVIELSSTQMHTLDLGIYTMTAANNKSAISIIPNGRSSAGYALDIKADASNPGGISAPGGSCIYSRGKSGVKDRPIIRIYGGNFTGKYAINHSGSNGTNCPQFRIYGGNFDQVSTNRAMLNIYGGTFNKKNWISPDSSAYTRIEGGRFFDVGNNMMSALNSDKWTYGTEKGVFDVDIYVDEEGYYVVTKEDVDMSSMSANVKVKSNSTLVYSKANTDGIYYVNALASVMNNTNGNVTLYETVEEDIKTSGNLTIDMSASGADLIGDVTLGAKNHTFTVVFDSDNPYSGTVIPYNGCALKVTETMGTIVTRTYSNTEAYAKIDDSNYATLEEAVSCVKNGETITLLKDVELADSIVITKDAEFTIDGNGKKISPASDSTETNSAFNLGQGNDDTRLSKKYNFKNIVFDGWTTDHVIRCQGITTEIENCIFTNCNQPDGLGIVTLTFADAKIKNCTFENNICVKGVDVNSWGDDSESTSVIEGCIFSNNTVSGVGVIYYNDGASLNVNNNRFIANTVNTTGNAATVYMGFNNGIKVTGNIFEDNSVTTSLDRTTRVSGAVFAGFVGNECEISGNAFINNTAVANGNNAAASVAYSAYYASGNISGNYWNKTTDPILGSDFTHEYPTVHSLVIDDYYTVKNDDLDGNFTLSDIKYIVRDVIIDFVDVSNESAEGEKIYNINITAIGKIINRLNSADISFVHTQMEGNTNFEIIPCNPEVVINPVDNSKLRYEFHYSGKTSAETDTAETITIGQIKFTGYGTFSFAVDLASDTNVVHATKNDDNIVDTFVPGGNSELNYGTLDISDDEISNIEIAVPERELRINITFPNTISYNAADYQDMTVTIVGGNVDETIKLGMEDTYSITRELPYNTAYTVTVSGAGYRTARYTVTLTEDKTLNFWNNVMDEAKVMENGLDSSSVTKNFLAGDIVKDNNINIYDLSAVVSYFAENSTVENGYAKYDLNRDGIIDSKDVAYVLVSWGE